MKIFISQLMRGKTEEEILTDRYVHEEHLKEVYGEDTEFIDSIDFSRNDPVFKLGIAISNMADADAVVFAPDALKYGRGCKLEYAVALAYNKSILSY